MCHLLYSCTMWKEGYVGSVIFTIYRFYHELDSAPNHRHESHPLNELHTIEFGPHIPAHVRRPLYTPLPTSCSMPSRLYCICNVSPVHIQEPTADPESRTPGNANPRRGLNRAIHDRPPGLKKGMSSRRLYDAPDMHAKSRVCRSSYVSISLLPLNRPRAHGAQSSVNRSSNCILRIMTSNPMVTIISSANPNHPNIIAEVPTPDLTLPFPRSCAIVLAATDAVCCHSTETRTKTEAIKIRASATCETGREGKGLTSLSEPRSSVSSCQPGKVARRRKVTKARTMATILR